MRVALLNGSPKGAKSASEVILNFTKEVLPDSLDFVPIFLQDSSVTKQTLEQITSCDILIWAFPLYVDGVPAHLLAWFWELEKIYSEQENSKPWVYALVNCGFYEADQNQIMLEIIKNWATKSGLVWGQGLGFGAGGVFHALKSIPLGKWPFLRIARAFQELSLGFMAEQDRADLFVSPDFSRFSYKLIAELGWRRSILKNGLKLRDLQRTIDLEVE